MKKTIRILGIFGICFLSCLLGCAEKVVLNPNINNPKPIQIKRSEYEKRIIKFAEQFRDSEFIPTSLVFYTTDVSWLRGFYIISEDNQESERQKQHREWNDYIDKQPGARIKVGFSKSISEKRPLQIDIHAGFPRSFNEPTYAFLAERNAGDIIILYPNEFGFSFATVNCKGQPAFGGCTKPKPALYDLVVVVDYGKFQINTKFSLDFSLKNPTPPFKAFSRDGEGWEFTTKANYAFLKRLCCQQYHNFKTKTTQFTHITPDLYDNLESLYDFKLPKVDPRKPVQILSVDGIMFRVRFHTGNEVELGYSWFEIEEAERAFLENLQ